MRESGTYELVELDPESGKEDHLVTTGTQARLTRELARMISAFEDDWDTFGQSWPWLRIQPAS